MALKVGEVAPDFSLKAVVRERQVTFTLSELRGQKNVVLAFYPLDWTPTCSAEMPALQADLAKFASFDTEVVGISMDSVYSHIAWQEKGIGWLDYPLASDFFPHGEVARKYDIFREKPPIIGINERAIFVIDKQGIIRFAQVYDLGQQPDTTEVFAVLEQLKAAA